MPPPSSLQNDPILGMLPEVLGRRILRPCVLYARLGRGGMGAVYLGKHLTLQQKQVVKCLWLMGQGGQTDEVFVDRFHQEARIAAAMTHQNLVRVTHIDRLGELHYLVMEYIEGEDMDRRVKRRGRLDEAQALTLLHGAASGLGYAHARGIVHRDVKPANLMVSVRGEVKVIDLGLARAAHNPQQLQATIGTLGTPLFMAPEQWDSPRVGPTADVWALGASLYYMLAGRSHVPAAIDEPSALRKFITESPFPELDGQDLAIDAATRRILRRCVERDPAARYADARELAQDLARLITPDESLLADPDGAPVVKGQEPDSDELVLLQAELERLSDGAGQGTRAAAAEAEATTAADEPAAGIDATMPFPGEGRTLPFQPAVAAGKAPRAATPAPNAPRAAAASAPPAMAPATVAPSTRKRPVPALPGLLAAGVVALLGTAAGVIAWPRLDPEAIQKEAMAAIYQERFADADQLLARLEASPPFADQARRLRVDALVKDAQRLAPTQPVPALQRLGTATVVAKLLLIPKDVEDAQARIEAARAPLAAALQAQLAALVTSTEPAAGAVLQRARQQITVQLAAHELQLGITLEGRELRPAGSQEAYRLDWPVPDRDGPHELRFVVEEATTHVQHTVVVPIAIKRGTVALQVEPPAVPSRGDGFSCTGRVTNGPLAVRAVVTRPDGSVAELDLGSRDGTFEFQVPGVAGQDGEYQVQLRATLGEQALASVPGRARLDRVPPQLTLAASEHRTAGATYLLRGQLDEPGRIGVRGQPATELATDEQGTFTLPLRLPAHDGSAVFELDVHDRAGNAAAAVSITVEVDRTAPQFVGGTLQPAAAVTNAATTTLRGQLDEPGTITVGDAAPLATAPDGSFVVTAALPVGTIDAPVPLRLQGFDRTGNATAPTMVPVVVDRTGPKILPGAPDGSWWANGQWMLVVEDSHGPCRVTLDGTTLPTDAQGRVVFPLRSSAQGSTVHATDDLGNTSERTLASPRPNEGSADKQAPGPTWGTPVEGSTIDPVTNLYERIALPIGTQRLILRLLRPLRDDELPPAAQREPKAMHLLQGQPPCYLAETEVPMAVWAEFVATGSAPTAAHGMVWDPATCRWHDVAGADWQQPLHPQLRDATPAAARATWPVTQVTPEMARAFCQHYGVRLPHEHEWWFAARMGSRSRYGGHGNANLEDRANLADLALQAQAKALAAFETVDDGWAGLCGVDTFPRGAAAHPWGFRGLLGNAAEWCVTSRDRIVARGGSWLSLPRELRVDELPKDGLITTGAWDHIGFRVVKDL